ncbi:hypothetical protein PENTCL1PPCAC_4736 [Pristionchus entomophagus]|uniref:SHSP domain-containing protein n=1 Tax=Pristionchus entomophagus TaxID=358040 RepID=A0AAV5SGX5_9BILA|nr:hypothetical protein PENTCL1PPCAC_4736 [Pristionchus entomophagus]
MILREPTLTTQAMSCSPSEKSPVSPVTPQGFWDWPLKAVHNDSEKFELRLDAQPYTPKEIEVKVVGRLLDIHADHKSSQSPKAPVTSSLNRSFELPDDVNEHAIRTRLSPRGTLVITVFKKLCTTNPRILLQDNAWMGTSNGGVFAHPGLLDSFPVQRSFDDE